MSPLGKSAQVRTEGSKQQAAPAPAKSAERLGAQPSALYRDIMVHVPLEGSLEQVELAARLAKAFGAHLTGFCALRKTAMLKDLAQNPFAHVKENSPETEHVIVGERVAAFAAEQRFRVIAERQGITHEWQVGEGDPADLIILASRLQDLVVVEQPAPASDLLWGSAVRVAQSGRPVLVVPHSGLSPGIPCRAVVAWNGSTQAAAAVRQALPLLVRADEVIVLLDHSRETFPRITRLPPLDICGYLLRHRIGVTARSLGAPNDEAGVAILETAANANADLIVMGAYGRSRFSEWVLGGATRHVLQHMTVPAFMAR